MSTEEWVDSLLRLAEILVSWPAVGFAVLLVIRPWLPAIGRAARAAIEARPGRNTESGARVLGTEIWHRSTVVAEMEVEAADARAVTEIAAEVERGATPAALLEKVAELERAFEEARATRNALVHSWHRVEGAVGSAAARRIATHAVQLRERSELGASHMIASFDPASEGRAGFRVKSDWPGDHALAFLAWNRRELSDHFGDWAAAAQILRDADWGISVPPFDEETFARLRSGDVQQLAVGVRPKIALLEHAPDASSPVRHWVE